MSPHVDLIQGGARRNKALFHSFEDFNVRLGKEVSFANPKGVRNILTRVTGPFRSNILGTLGVGGKANLIFLNPNGVYFGARSRLNIAGSFFASSATALDLGDGVLFRADTSEVPSILTIRIPIGVQWGARTGEIVNRGILQSGGDLTLEGDRLIVSGEVRAGRDLLLQGNELLIRERNSSFIGAAGRHFELAGQELVDINVLEFPGSGLFSGGDLLLRSTQPIIADARFVAGRHLRFEGWGGEFGDVLSETDPVIFSNGNVTFGDYKGASLHILAGGDVRLGDITITEAGPIESTINPKNQTKVNGTLTYGDLSSFEVSDFELIKNTKGGLDRIPTRQKVEIDGHEQATLDVRAGVNWKALGGLPNDSVLGDDFPSINMEGITNSRIIIDGNVRINKPRGKVLLTNRFSPNNELKAGRIMTQSIDTSVEGVELDAGDVAILGRGKILNSLIDASSTVALNEFGLPLNRNENSGNGGEVNISSTFGNIKNSQIFTSSKGNIGRGGDIIVSSISGSINNQDLRAYSYSAYGNSGHGGDIKVSSITGSIDNQDLRASSFSTYSNSDHGGDIMISSSSGSIGNQYLLAYSFSGGHAAGDGGDISVSSVSGSIDNQDLRAYSYSRDGTSGAGGDITVSSVSGSIDNKKIRTNSDSRAVNSGRGGDITVSSVSGSIDNKKLRAYSYSRDGTSGRGGDIIVSSVSGIIENQDLYAYSFSRDGTSGRGGDIMVSSISGNVDNQNLLAYSYSIDGTSGEAGDIVVSSVSGSIDNQDLRTSSNSKAVNSGDGGDIKVSSVSGSINNQYLLAYSYSRDGTTGGGGNIKTSSVSGNIDNQDLFTYAYSRDGNSGQGGDIKVTSVSGNIKFEDNVQSFSYTPIGRAESAGSIIVIAKQGSILGLNQFEPKPRFLAFSIGDQASGIGGNIELTSKSIQNLELLTLSSSEKSGTLSVSGLSQSLLLRDLDVIASARLIIQPFNLDRPPIKIDTSTIGASGNVTIASSGNALIENVNIESNSNGLSPAGNFKLNASGSLLLKNSQISTNANSEGRAGDFKIAAKNFILDDSQLTATAKQQAIKGNSQLGNINIDVENLLLLTNNSLISTRGFDDANGGNIKINSPKRPANLVIGLTSNANGNDIIANALGGRGGNIIIDSNFILGFTRSQPILNNRTNDINASSRTRLQGNVEINSTETVPSENIPTLPRLFRPSILRKACHPGGENRFVTISKGAKKAKLGDMRVIPTWARLASLPQQSKRPSKHPSSQIHKPTISEAQGWVKDNEGTIQLVKHRAKPLSIELKPDFCKTN